MESERLLLLALPNVICSQGGTPTPPASANTRLSGREEAFLTCAVNDGSTLP